MSDSIDIAVYSYRGPERLDCLLKSIRYLGHKNKIVVAEDRSDDAMAAKYDRVCDQYEARHVRLEQHGHMCGANQRAVMECSSDFILVCSDDVMIPRGLIDGLEAFLYHNCGAGAFSDEVLGFTGRIAGVFLHHWDRADIIEMSERGDIPELPDFQEKDFFSGQGEWFWKHLDGRLPYGGWSEPSPADKLGIVSNVHGSAFVTSKWWWDQVDGCSGIDCWQNDSVYSFRIGQWTDAFIVRLPWLPSLPHFGGAADTPADSTGKWEKSMATLGNDHGFWLREPWRIQAHSGATSPGRAISNFEIIEYGLKLRADSLQKKFARIIDAIDYSYRDVVEPL